MSRTDRGTDRGTDSTTGNAASKGTGAATGDATSKGAGAATGDATSATNGATEGWTAGGSPHEGAGGAARKGPGGAARKGSSGGVDRVARGLGVVAAAVARQVTRWVARWVAAVRRGRALHPRGLLLRATLTVESELLGEHGEHEVPVRLSKGVSLPGRLPDVLGLAVRLPNGVDLLLSTGYGFVPVPRRGFTSGPYSTLASYYCGQRRCRIVARPEGGRRVPVDPAELPGVLERRDLVFHLWAGVQYLGRLRIHTALPDGDLTFDPLVNSVPYLRPASRLQVLRGAAYAGSRRGRGAKLGEGGE
ncbi:hypothetical protein [Nonomuraea sp. NPDC049504]|uniref:hypothetical protein n=1 Tax=Nonomuraea sp. NPDC049504 TaxID=3154729 RepID=UPI00342A4115